MASLVAPSKPVRCGNPTLARFDSGAAPLREEHAQPVTLLSAETRLSTGTLYRNVQTALGRAQVRLHLCAQYRAVVA